MIYCPYMGVITSLTFLLFLRFLKNIEIFQKAYEVSEKVGNKTKSHNSEFRLASDCSSVVVLKEVSQEIKNQSYDLIQKGIHYTSFAFLCFIQNYKNFTLNSNVIILIQCVLLKPIKFTPLKQCWLSITLLFY